METYGPHIEYPDVFVSTHTRVTGPNEPIQWVDEKAEAVYVSIAMLNVVVTFKLNMHRVLILFFFYYYRMNIRTRFGQRVRPQILCGALLCGVMWPQRGGRKGGRGYMGWETMVQL